MADGEHSTRPVRGAAGYVIGTGVVALATVLGLLVLGRDHLADAVMTYLLGVVLVAMRFDFRVSVATAVLSVLAFDFFFVPPYLTLTVTDIRHIVTFGVMLVVAVVVAGLTQRVKDQVDVARRSERRTGVLYAMNRELAGAQAPAAAISVACRHIEDVLDARTAVFTRDARRELRRCYATEGLESDAVSEMGIVRWVWSNRRHAGLGTDVVAADGLYVPLFASSADTDVAGVLGVFPRDRGRLLDQEQRKLVDALATQMAIAMERARLAEEADRTRVQVETEQLRNTLLSSVSHDLRTPLAVMKGAASTLVEDEHALAPSTRRDLAQTILEETDRLERLVRNLLDMTRLESGAIRLRREWQSVEEVVGGSLTRVESRLGARNVSTRIPRELLAPLDGVLIEQVLVNLLENAAKHTPDGSPIEIEAAREGDDVVIGVADRGPGLADGEETVVFEKFHRATSDRNVAGFGLGLAICRAIVRAHGGRIWAEKRAGGGACFKLAMPLGGEAPRGELPEFLERAG